MTELRLPNRLHQQLIDYAAQHPEAEVCGLLGGHWQPFPKLAIATQCIPITNIAMRPNVHFVMHSAEQHQALTQLAKQKQEFLGIYHSHPHGPARLSQHDITQMRQFPDLIQLLIAPEAVNGAYRLQAWRVVRGKTKRVSVVQVD